MDPSGNAKSKSSEEDWRNITDPTERKRIQNRLSQRLRRSKLASKKANSLLQRSRQIEGSSERVNDDALSPDNHPSQSTSTDLNICSRLIPGNIQKSLDPTTDNHFIVMHNMTTFAAFIRNAIVLELACTPEAGFHIGAPTHTLPQPITPTLQQQIVPHKTYIDMLPWSSLRDRILNSLRAINEPELMLDMSSGDLKVWGSIPWDPMGWEVGPEFAKKWWFLMDDGIIRTTNFWRGQRGEPALVLPSR